MLVALPLCRPGRGLSRGRDVRWTKGAFMKVAKGDIVARTTKWGAKYAFLGWDSGASPE